MSRQRRLRYILLHHRSRLIQRSTVFALLWDVSAIALACIGAYWMRFSVDAIPPYIQQSLLLLLATLIPIHIISAYFFGLYRSVWRYVSISDLSCLLKTILTTTAIATLTLFFMTRLNQVPRTIIPIYLLLVTGLMAGMRMSVRRYKERSRTNKGKRVLIIGAGQAGEGIARELLRHRQLDYQPIAFIDDNPHRKGKEIHGIRIVGKCRTIADMVIKYQIDLIMIAVPSASPANMRRIVNYCEMTGVPFRTLPSVNDLTHGRVTIDALRSVALEDLLGREQVNLDWSSITRDIENKAVLITGGGGSIGSELCRQISGLSPKALIIFDHNENNLYQIETELREHFPQLALHPYLANITDTQLIDTLMEKHQPQIVFHAAAYKHVPMLETQQRIAIKNNILGTQIIATASAAHKAETFVLISTDKAVNPTNIMGATKRVAEIFCQNFNRRTTTHFITVRFGNVLNSSGSVIPLFRKQLAKGGPITVTHPDITRYFMTIPEACRLILQAATLGQGGEIFVLNMGEPVKIRYLAEQIIKLAGKVLNDDIEIKYIGLRPGEKLHEELFHKEESLTGTAHEKILQAEPRSMDWNILVEKLNQLSEAVHTNKTASLLELLQDLVPEYRNEQLEERCVSI